MHVATSLRIRPLTESDSIAELTDLLHRAYAELGERGLRFTAVDQTETTTRARIERGRCFVAVLNGEIIGTITFYSPSPNAVSAWYRLPGVATFGQFGVDPAHRGKRIGMQLLAHVEALARAEGAVELALDTAENAIALVDMYASMGFRVVGHDDHIVPAYRSIVMSKTLS